MTKTIVGLSAIVAVVSVMGCAADKNEGPSESWDYDHQTVNLTEDLVIGVDETVRVGPGTTFIAVEGVRIRVLGTLIAEGTAAERVRFEGPTATPRAWEGIEIEDGALAELTQVAISGATYGIHALPGSDFDVSYSELSHSFKAALIYSDGSFDHVTFHASGDAPDTIGELDPSLDPDGALAIIDGSPSVTHSTFDGSHSFSDMIRVRGNSQATFDHLLVTEAHCAFHVQDAENNSPRITNTIMQGMAFGIMAYAGKPVMEDNVFLDNEVDVGFCYGATTDNTPELTNNFYSSGGLVLDAACARINTADASPAEVANPNAGPDTL